MEKKSNFAEFLTQLATTVDITVEQAQSIDTIRDCTYEEFNYYVERHLRPQSHDIDTLIREYMPQEIDDMSRDKIKRYIRMFLSV